MPLTRSAIAAALLAAMVSAAYAQAASAQSGDSRQIQVLPAPAQQQVAQAQEPATDGATADPEQSQPETQAQAAQKIPQGPPATVPQDIKPAPKFTPVAPKFVAPKRPAYAAGYGDERGDHAGYGYPKRYRNHCH
jgi:hypothetical protein